MGNIPSKWSKEYRAMFRKNLGASYTIGIVMFFIGVVTFWTGIGIVIAIVGIILILVAKSKATGETDSYFIEK